MASSLGTFRQQYPQYDKYDDQQLADALYDKFYVGKIDKADYLTQLGLGPKAGEQKPAEQKTTEQAPVAQREEFAYAPPFEASPPPISEDMRKKLDVAYNAATPEQRQQMASRKDYVGQYIQFLDNQYKQKDELVAEDINRGAIPASMADLADPRREARARTARRQGAEPQTAQNIAAQQAIADVPPEIPVGQVAPSEFDFELSQQFKNAPTPIRGAVKGFYEYKRGVLGVNQAIGDLLGAEEFAASQERGAKEPAAAVEAIGVPGNEAAAQFENAVSSISENLPSIIAGIATGGATVPLSALFVQTFGKEYNEGKSKGLSSTQSAERAGLFGIAEVVGELVGLPKFLRGFGGSLANKSFSEATDAISEYIVKQFPGEQLTTALEFLADKYPDFALNPKATLKDYLSQAGATAVQTVLQGGVMLGGVKATQLALTGSVREPGALETTRANLAQQEALRKWQEEGFARPKPETTETAAPPPTAPTVTPEEQAAAPAITPEEQVAAAAPTTREDEAIPEAPTSEAPAPAGPAETSTIGDLLETTGPVRESALNSVQPDFEEMNRQLLEEGAITEEQYNQFLEDQAQAEASAEDEDINRRLREASMEDMEEAGTVEAPKLVTRGKKEVTQLEAAKMDLTNARRNYSGYEAQVRGVLEQTGQTIDQLPVTTQQVLQGLQQRVTEAETKYNALLEDERQAASIVEPGLAIEDLKSQQAALLTKAGKPPAVKSPARARYDALQQQIDQLEKPTEEAAPAQTEVQQASDAYDQAAEAAAAAKQKTRAAEGKFQKLANTLPANDPKIAKAKTAFEKAKQAQTQAEQAAKTAGATYEQAKKTATKKPKAQPSVTPMERIGKTIGQTAAGLYTKLRELFRNPQYLDTHVKVFQTLEEALNSVNLDIDSILPSQKIQRLGLGGFEDVFIKTFENRIPQDLMNKLINEKDVNQRRRMLRNYASVVSSELINELLTDITSEEAETAVKRWAEAYKNGAMLPVDIELTVEEYLSTGNVAYDNVNNYAKNYVVINLLYGLADAKLMSGIYYDPVYASHEISESLAPLTAYILDSYVKATRKNRFSAPVSLDKNALNLFRDKLISNRIENGILIPTLNKNIDDVGSFITEYRKMVLENDPNAGKGIKVFDDQNSLVGTWYKYEGEENAPYMAVRSCTTWCTSRGSAIDFLSDGANFWIFEDLKGSPKYAVAVQPDGDINQVQDVNNNGTLTESGLAAVKLLYPHLQPNVKDRLVNYLRSTDIVSDNTAKLRRDRQIFILQQAIQTGYASPEDIVTYYALRGISGYILERDLGGDYILGIDQALNIDDVVFPNIRGTVIDDLAIGNTKFYLNNDLFIGPKTSVKRLHASKYSFSYVAGRIFVAKEKVIPVATDFGFYVIDVADDLFATKDNQAWVKLLTDKIARAESSLANYKWKLEKETPEAAKRIAEKNARKEDIPENLRSEIPLTIKQDATIQEIEANIADISMELRILKQLQAKYPAGYPAYFSINERLFHELGVAESALFRFPTRGIPGIRALEKAFASSDVSAMTAGDSIQGFYDPQTGTVSLIADAIPVGQELGVILHEIGAHMGMKALLGDALYAKLGEQIIRWSRTYDTENRTEEEIIAARAKQRVLAAGVKSKYEGYRSGNPEMDEIIAYFIEEAANAGYTPTQIKSNDTSPLAEWMRRVWDAIHKLIAKLGADPFHLKTQDLIDLAYGAALKALQKETPNGNARKETVLLFSKAKAPRPAKAPKVYRNADRVINRLKQNAKTPVEAVSKIIDVLADRAEVKVWQAVFPLLPDWAVRDKLPRQLVKNGDRFELRSMLPQFDTYDKALAGFERTQKELEGEIKRILDIGLSLPKETHQALSLLQLEATAREIDPDVNTKDAYLNQLWSNLQSMEGGAKAIEVYREQRAFYKKIYNKIRSIASKNLYKALVRRGYTPTEAAAKTKEILDRDMPQRKDPYFPMARFGEYWVGFKMLNDEGKLEKGFLMFESGIARDNVLREVEAAIRDEVRAANPGMSEQDIDDVIVNEERIQARDGFSNLLNFVYGQENALSKARDMIGDSLENMVAELQKSGTATVTTADAQQLLQKAKNDAIGTIQQILVQLAPAGSVKRLFAKRKNIAGAVADSNRSFAVTATKQMNYLAKIMHGPEMEAALISANEALKYLKPRNQIFAGMVVKEFELRMESNLNPTPQESWVQLASGTAFAYQMTTTASAIRNFMYMMWNGLSVLSSELGGARTSALMSKYLTKFPGGIYDVNRPDGIKGVGFPSLLVNKGLNKFVRYGLERAVAENKLNISQAYDLAELRRTPSGVPLMSWRGIWDSPRRIVNSISFALHNSERMGREVLWATALEGKARQLFKEKKPDGSRKYTDAEISELSYQFANEYAGERGAGTFGYQRRGRVFKMPRWNLILKYKSAPIQVTFLQFRSLDKLASHRLRRWIREERQRIMDDPQLGPAAVKEFEALMGKERMAALKYLAFLTAITFMWMGLEGTPFWWLLERIAGYFLRKNDPNKDNPEAVGFDLNLFIENYMQEQMGDPWAQSLMRGPMANLSNISLVDQMSFNVPSMFLQGWSDTANKSNMDALEKGLIFFLGPVFGGLPSTAAMALDAGKRDTMRGVEMLLPGAFKTPLAARRVYTQGFTTSKGEVIIPPEQVTGYDLFLVGLGFSPEDYRRYQKSRFEVQTIENRIALQRAEILDDYYFVNLMPPGKEQDEALAAVEKRVENYNAAYPSKEIDGSDMEASLTRRLKAQSTAAGMDGYSKDETMWPVIESQIEFGKLRRKEK